MRVLVCGGRDFTDDDWFYEVMNEINDTYNFHNKISCIIEGGAKGADAMAFEFARVNGIVCEEFLADWDRHGKAAGHIRNQTMLTQGRPDLCVAFPGGRGTADMVRRARAAGVEVREIS